MIFCAVVTAGSGQLPLPADNRFEVVSIRPTASGGCAPRSPSRAQLRLENCSVEYLVKQVLTAMKGYDLTGLPKWTSSEWYTIVAKSARPAGTLDQLAMLRPVMEDRFKLKWHREKREMPVWFLSASKGGVQLPLTAPGSCVAIDPIIGAGPPPDPGKLPSCGMMFPRQTPQGEIRLDGIGIRMSQLASLAESRLDRPVIDHTDVTGPFDVHLSYARTESPAIETTDSESFPSITEAFKKVGLVLTRGRGPVEIVVIDHIERPPGD
jgi:uncharacterized protein (TIGR03435 family)